MKNKIIVLILSLMCFSIGLNGCKDTGKEEAVAEAAKAKTELAAIKEVLGKTEIERDELKARLAEISESFKAAQTKIDGLLQNSSQATDIKDKIAELTKDRDAAVAKATDAQTMIEKLKSQLQEQILKVTGLEGQNQKLMEVVEQLKKQLGSDVKVPELPKL